MLLQLVPQGMRRANRNLYVKEEGFPFRCVFYINQIQLLRLITFIKNYKILVALTSGSHIDLKANSPSPPDQKERTLLIYYKY